MTKDEVETFLMRIQSEELPVQIGFKTRKSFVGLFIKTGDYTDLKSKNFWRIVGASKIDEYKVSGNRDLARIYNGMEFTRLSKVQ
ncbi:short-chain dehydrogenase [Agriterribacter sp.]|uniref:short-chain dehydrogenase n=1 Tax=Agriterribacter sp. TaxID=2821509 RepID=UPI002C097DE5|nr:short-chain dehydrogenase [Agriterribacter sp.]HRO47870.1 short-chain dehydrogenase [Agriterribacter sp.]HRQ18834.1 short-chain dehydrogenase [Agriterribacter sp.]